MREVAGLSPTERGRGRERRRRIRGLVPAPQRGDQKLLKPKKRCLIRQDSNRICLGFQLINKVGGGQA
jgi:hypothetical protein